MLSVRAKGFFDEYAKDFDTIYSTKKGLIQDLVNELFRKSMSLRFEKTIEGCDPIEGMSVLDVGCGPGHYCVTLARRGAVRVLGIDFAEGMLGRASEHAQHEGVADRCEFLLADFTSHGFPEPFDYVILMGLMDYIANPQSVIEKALSLTRSKAFFSFPVAGGLLAWQRQLRYRKRCELYLYSEGQITELFASARGFRIAVEKIARDYFVTAVREATQESG
jgi:2-polyprenyl-3-methyl-5-hydroxy-6-metoxy-1,4-benzoquinol methylase